MNNYLIGFKNNFLETIFKLTMKNWLKTTGAYAIMYGITIVLAISFFLMIISSIGIFELEDLTNFQTISMKMALFNASIFTPIFFILIGVLIIISVIIASWLTNFSFILTDNEINEKPTGFSTILKQSISPIIFKLFGIILLLYFMFIVGFGISMLMLKLSGLITLVLFFITTVTMIRFTLILPAVLIGNKSLAESFSFSLKMITWLRALKLFGIILLVSLGIFLVLISISLLGFIFNLIPFVGQVIQMGIQVFLSAFTLAFSISSLMGLYYRFTNESSDVISEAEVIDYTPTQE